MEDLKYWLAFNRIKGIGRARFSSLETHFGSLREAWNGSPTDLKEAGLDQRSIDNIVANRPHIDPNDEMEKLAENNIRALTWHDPEYPPRLKEVHDLPPVLYVRGSLESQDEWSIAVVGTRHATAYGREMAEVLAEDLGSNRITVISGLARGIDSLAHKAALKAGGRTIAVQACGLDIVYPAEHLNLAREIIESGALVSDYPPGTRPKSDHFPRRNRIMSGMALGTLVIEAGESSGALITADLALEQNREVFAIPGSVLSAKSRGTNRLISEGAKLVSRVEDILEELNLTMVPQQMEMKELIPVTDMETSIIKHLSREPLHIDEVRRRAHLPIATISSALAMMELKGMVKQVGAMNYVLTREVQADYRVAV